MIDEEASIDSGQLKNTMTRMKGKEKAVVINITRCRNKLRRNLTENSKKQRQGKESVVSMNDVECRLCEIKFHFWGSFETKLFHHYKGGEFSSFIDLNVDMLGLTELDYLVETVKVFGEKKYYSLVEEHGFHMIESDEEVRAMCEECHLVKDKCVVYVDVVNRDELLDTPIEDDQSYNPSASRDKSEYEKDSEHEDWERHDSAYEDVDCDYEYEKNDNTSLNSIKVRFVSNIENISDNKAYENGSELDSLRGSDFDVDVDDEVRDKLYIPSLHANDPPLDVGLTFSNMDELKEAIRVWSVKRGRPLKFKKNDKLRVMAICPFFNNPNYLCDWMLTARRFAGGYMEIRKFKQNHKCPYACSNPSVGSGWIGKRYANLFKENPKLDAKSFGKHVMKDNRINLTKNQVYKAKKKALTIVMGSENSQYARLYDYAIEIQRSNPGSTVSIKTVEDVSGKVSFQPRFQRMYICFEGVKKGFMEACMPWFGIDGTHLKGSCEGILLTAVGADANNGVFLIAYAVVEVESGDSWGWFLALLKNDLQIIDTSKWTIMSDKQKGLIQACKSIFPYADHKYCVKHLHKIFMDAGFRGNAFRNALWSPAKSKTLAKYNSAIGEIFSLDENAAVWLQEKPPSEWSRAHFSTYSKCDQLLNNMCETYNGKILDERELPILAMFEGLRIKLMEKMAENRSKTRIKWSPVAICPRIFKVIDDATTRATRCYVRRSTETLFEVECGMLNEEQYAIDLARRTCGCRKWELSGIPCSHAIAAILAAGKDPVDYVDEYYSVKKYLQAYQYGILPMNGMQEWERSGQVAPLPPLYVKKKGRRDKSRKKSKAEIMENKEKVRKLSRKGMKGSCRTCGKTGHNKRCCPLNMIVDNETTPEPEFDSTQSHIAYSGQAPNSIPSHRKRKKDN